MAEKKIETRPLPKIFTAEDDGLQREWFGKVFLNPPGGLVNQFWRKLLVEWRAERMEQAIWIGYSLEQLQTLQQSGADWTPLDFPNCFTSRRIAFVENAAKKAERIAKLLAKGKKPNEKSSPSHSNYVTYIGRRKLEFKEVFSQFGQVILK